MELLCVHNILNDFQKLEIVASSEVDWVNLIATLGAVATGIAAIIYSGFHTSASHREARITERRNNIKIKLDEFYGPLYQLRMKSHLIYNKFNAAYREKNAEFATLNYLLENKKFYGNDEILLREIIKLGEQCEQLIHNKAGLIDDLKLRTEIIPRTLTHFLLLRLAYQGVLSGEVSRFKDLTFPTELDALLEKRREELETELNNLLTVK